MVSIKPGTRHNCLNLTDSDLQGRGQAQNETSMAVDPNNPAHLVASYNDYRRGDGTCGVSYSLNGGKTWADTTTPNGFVRGDFTGTAREYWQAGGDTSVAWDTKGNAYLSCQTFNRGSGASPNPDQSSGFFVYRSTGTNGASFNFPGRAGRRAQRHRRRRELPARQAAADRRQPPGQQVRRPDLRHLDNVRRRRHRLHLRGLLRGLRRDLLGPRPGQHGLRLVWQHLRSANPAGQVQREPGLPAFHRTGWHPVRRLQQLQQRRDRL